MTLSSIESAQRRSGSVVGACSCDVEALALVVGRIYDVWSVVCGPKSNS
jgi:hypothetical protein